MNRFALSTRSIATGAFAGFALFPAVVLLLNIVQRDQYHPLRQAISELALGRSGWLLNLAFCAMGAGTLLLALSLRRSVAGGRVVPALLAVAGLLDFVSAAFHADGAGATTGHGQIHQVAGIATFLLVVVAIFLSARSFRRDPAWGRLARPSLLWGGAAVATFFLIPVLGEAYFGLAQRIFISTWLSWALVVAAFARTLAPAGEGLRHREVVTSLPSR